MEKALLSNCQMVATVVNNEINFKYVYDFMIVV